MKDDSMEPNIDKLIDHARIEAQAAKHAAATERLAAARVAVDDASKDHGTAEAAADAAISGASSDCPHLTTATQETAAARLAVAQKVLAGCEAARQKTEAGINVARALAWRPVALAGMRARVDAARKFDAAQAMIKQADEDHRAATALIDLAAANGTSRIGYANDRARILVSEEAERFLWESAGVNLEKGTMPWDPGAY